MAMGYMAEGWCDMEELRDRKPAGGRQGAFAGTDGLPMPHEGMRFSGLCRRCRDLVELDGSLHDPHGHGPGDMARIAEVPCGRPLRRLPRFNWGAFLMPPIWGAGHGQVFAVVLYPIWILVDDLLWEAHLGRGSALLAALALAGTLLFMYVYARNANYMGYLRVMGSKTPEEYLAGERAWSVWMAVLALLMVGFATWYNLTCRA